MDVAVVGALVGAVGGLAGIGGVVVGAIALSQAKSANKLAEDANEKSEAANKLSAGSNAIAQEANGIAVEANELSHNANAIAERQAALQSERNDVAWDYDWVKPGVLRLTNYGDGEARDVRVRMVVWSEDQSGASESVRKGEFIDLDFPRARQEELKYEWELRQYEAGRGEWRVMPPLRLPDKISGKALWVSPLGVPGSQDL